MSDSKITDYKDEVIEAVHQGLNNQEIADRLYDKYKFETTRHSVRRLKSKLNLDKGAEKPTTKLSPNEATILSDAGVDISDTEKIIRDRGLDPKEWDYNGVTINEWDSPTGETLRQLKINLARKTPIDLIMPARIDGPKWEKPKVKPIPESGALFVVSGDDQAPNHNPYLHEKMCEFLEYNQPHTIIKIGDTNDFPTLSRYKPNPELDAIAQECVDSGHMLLRDERAAAPDARIIKLVGNHDMRLRDYQLAKAPEIYGLTRAKVPGEDREAPVLSLEHLLRLDELGIELVGDYANYEHGEVKVSNFLAVRHGWVAKKGSGASALSTLEQLLYSVMVGHTHRLAIIHKTVHTIDGDLIMLAAAETGCMCNVKKDGLGYTPSPDWQPGFATVEVFPDGRFHIDLANFVDGNIYWRGNKF